MAPFTKAHLVFSVLHEISLFGCYIALHEANESSHLLLAVYTDIGLK